MVLLRSVKATAVTAFSLCATVGILSAAATEASIVDDVLGSNNLPLATETSFHKRFDGQYENGKITSVASGDVNCDGIEDAIFGSPKANANGSESGAVYVVFGDDDHDTVELDNGERDLEIAAQADVIVKGQLKANRLGASVAANGDFNGDGCNDLAIGAPGADGTNYDTGSAYVLFGRSGLADEDLSNGIAKTGSGNTGFRIFGTDSTVPVGSDMPGEDDAGALGTEVSFVKDMNFDSKDELVVSDPNYDERPASNTCSGSGDTFCGAAFVVHGYSGTPENLVANVDDPTANVWEADSSTADGRSSARVSTTTIKNRGWRIDGSGPQGSSNDYGSHLYSVQGGGDFNGDGRGDIVFGEPTGNGEATDSGIAGVIYGKSGVGNSRIDTLKGTQGRRYLGATEGDRAGQSVAFVPDMNGDDKDEIVIGAPGAQDSSGSDNRGYVYILPGATESSSTSVQNTNLSDVAQTPTSYGAMVAMGESGGNALGTSVDAAGDIDGDGNPDVLVGAPLASGIIGEYTGIDMKAGSVYVIYGPDPSDFGVKNTVANLSNAAQIDGASSCSISGEIKLPLSASSIGCKEGDDGDQLGGNAGVTLGWDAFRVGKTTAGSDMFGTRAVAGLSGNFENTKIAESGKRVTPFADLNNDDVSDLLVAAQGTDYNNLDDSGSGYMILAPSIDYETGKTKCLNITDTGSPSWSRDGKGMEMPSGGGKATSGSTVELPEDFSGATYDLNCMAETGSDSWKPDIALLGGGMDEDKVLEGMDLSIDVLELVSGATGGGDVDLSEYVAKLIDGLQAQLESLFSGVTANAYVRWSPKADTDSGYLPDGVNFYPADGRFETNGETCPGYYGIWTMKLHSPLDNGNPKEVDVALGQTGKTSECELEAATETTDPGTGGGSGGGGGGSTTETSTTPGTPGDTVIINGNMIFEIKKGSGKMSSSGYVNAYVRCSGYGCESVKLNGKMSRPTSLKKYKTPTVTKTNLPEGEWKLIKVKFSKAARKKAKSLQKRRKNVYVSFTATAVQALPTTTTQAPITVNKTSTSYKLKGTAKKKKKSKKK